MADDVNVTVTPNLSGLETNGRLLLQAVYSIQQAILSTVPRITGSFTLGAAATTVVSQPLVASDSIVLPFPSNAAAAALMGSAKSLYHDLSLNVAGTSFTVKTGNGVAAVGTEQFTYIVINPA
jgi:hypothetical protein